MASLTIENYVKAIYKICSYLEGKAAATGQLANELEVSPGTVTSMLKTLSASDLATYTPYEGVRLTEAGTRLALRVLRRHRLIETFLVKTLNLTWDEVHEEAEHMEHAVSDLLVDRIDEYLSYPETDPHGDPIPRSDGSVPVGQHPSPLRSLANCEAGVSFRFVRVLDQSPEFLRYLSDAGLCPGVEGDVVEQRRDQGSIKIRVGQMETTLLHDAAQKLLIGPKTSIGAV